MDPWGGSRALTATSGTYPWFAVFPGALVLSKSAVSSVLGTVYVQKAGVG